MTRAKRVLTCALLVLLAVVAATLLGNYLNTGHELVLSNVDQVPIAGGSVRFSHEPAVAFAEIRPGEARKLRILPRGRGIFDGGYVVVVRWQGADAESVQFLARGVLDKIDVSRSAVLRRGPEPDSGQKR